MNIAANITAAFAQLRRSGMIARSSYRCCQTCAWDAISDKAPPGCGGVAFFTQQDAHRLRKQGRTHVSFGSLDPRASDAERAKIGRAVTEALEVAGCVVVWSGSPDERLLVYASVEAFKQQALKLLGVPREQTAPRRRRRR